MLKMEWMRVQEEEPEEKRSILHQKLVHITLLITYAGLSAAVSKIEVKVNTIQ